MNPSLINQQVTMGNMELERVLKSMAMNLSVPMGTGNTYFVIPTTNPNYDQFVKFYQRQYEDETEMIQTSLANALTACTDDRMDNIVLASDYALTVTSSNVDINKDGVTIVGLGRGLNRPTFTFGAAAATMTVSADSCAVYNCHHIGNFDNVAAAYTLSTAKDFVLEGNSFFDNSSALHFISILVTGASNNVCDGLTVRGNNWHGLAVAPNAFVSILANESHVVIEDNVVNMAATNDVGHFLTLSSKVLLNASIKNNRLIVTGATNATVGVFLTGSSTTNTGLVENNYVSSLDTTTELIATAGTGLAFFENYYTGTADASGKLWPVVDGA